MNPTTEYSTHCVYVFVRDDIPKNRQIAQAVHAGIESGIRFGRPTKNPNTVVVLTVKDTRELIAAKVMAQEFGINTEMFYEPDWNYGFTSFATEPIPNDKRSIFKEFSLWSV